MCSLVSTERQRTLGGCARVFPSPTAPLAFLLSYSFNRIDSIVACRLNVIAQSSQIVPKILAHGASCEYLCVIAGLGSFCWLDPLPVCCASACGLGQLAWRSENPRSLLFYPISR